MRWQALKALVEWENGENEKPRAIRLIFLIIHILIIDTIIFMMMRESHQGLAINGHGRKGREWGPS